jgi:hypothetical protein
MEKAQLWATNLDPVDLIQAGPSRIQRPVHPRIQRRRAPAVCLLVQVWKPSFFERLDRS